jgi:hypothetical protein
MGLPQVQVVDAGQGAAVHANGGHGRQIPQLCQVGLKILPGPGDLLSGGLSRGQPCVIVFLRALSQKCNNARLTPPPLNKPTSQA